MFVLQKKDPREYIVNKKCLIISVMCKKKTKEEQAEKQRVEKNISVTWAFIFISIVFSLTMGFLVLWPVFHKNVNVSEVNISLSIPRDSLAINQVLVDNESQMKKLLEELDKQSQEITDKYNILLKSQETETDFFRLVSCITAFIVALFGFLGYRTIKDIEAKAQSLAADKADETAKDYVASHLETEVETQLRDLVGDTTAARLLREQLMKELIPLHITPLENRITILESEKPEKTKEEAVEDEPAEGAFIHGDVGKINEITTDVIKEEGGKQHE